MYDVCFWMVSIYLAEEVGGGNRIVMFQGFRLCQLNSFEDYQFKEAPTKDSLVLSRPAAQWKKPKKKSSKQISNHSRSKYNNAIELVSHIDS